MPERNIFLSSTFDDSPNPLNNWILDSTISRVPNQGINGSSCLYFAPLSNYYGTQTLTQSTDLIPGKTYRFKCQAKRGASGHDYTRKIALSLQYRDVNDILQSTTLVIPNVTIEYSGVIIVINRKLAQLGNRIRTHREARNISQEALAEQYAITSRQLGRMNGAKQIQALTPCIHLWKAGITAKCPALACLLRIWIEICLSVSIILALRKIGRSS